jgi:hypothetical protein
MFNIENDAYMTRGATGTITVSFIENIVYIFKGLNQMRKNKKSANEIRIDYIDKETVPSAVYQYCFDNNCFVEISESGNYIINGIEYEIIESSVCLGALVLLRKKKVDNDIKQIMFEAITGIPAAIKNYIVDEYHNLKAKFEKDSE